MNLLHNLYRVLRVTERAGKIGLFIGLFLLLGIDMLLHITNVNFDEKALSDGVAPALAIAAGVAVMSGLARSMISAQLKD